MSTGVGGDVSRGSQTTTPVRLDTMQAATSVQSAQPAPGTPPGQISPPQATAAPPPQQPPLPHTPTPSLRNKLLAQLSTPRGRLVVGVLLFFAIVIGAALVLATQRSGNGALSDKSASDFGSLNFPLANLTSTGAITFGDKTLSINGQLRANGSLIMTPAAQPAVPSTGQIYYDQTSNHLRYYNGTEFVQLQTDKDVQGNTTNNNNNVTNLSVTTGTVSTTNPAGGTTGKIAKFTSGQTLGDSILTDSNTFLEVNGGININVSSVNSDLSFFPTNPTPAVQNSPDGNGSVELGTKFTSDVGGQVKGLRFFKGNQNTGTHTGTLWSNTGTALASVTFGNETASGWQQAFFSTPVTITADTTYIMSYHTSAGFYAADNGYFGTHGVDNGPLHALGSGIDGGNGVFNYDPSPIFPTRTFQSTNYWVDVIFTGATYNNDSRYRVNGSQISSSDLSNDGNLAKRGSAQIFSGHNIFRNAFDSLEEFNIQRADTTALFTVDSTNLRVYIGSPGGADDTTLLVLGRKLNNLDPTGTEGGMYYNDVMKMFRCYSGGEWNNCADVNSDYSFSMYDEFMGGQTTSFTNNDNIGSLGWHAEAIGANGAISFNPATPTPVADRPGVLALQTPAVANQGTSLMLGNAAGGSMIISRNNHFKTSVAVGANTNQVLRIGLHNETSGTTQPVSGVWWEADPVASTNWRYCYGNGTTATCTPTTSPITANTWMHLEIIVVSTGAGTSAIQFILDNAGFAVTNVTVDTTNRVSPALSCYTTNVSAHNCYWDYFQLNGPTSAKR